MEGGLLDTGITWLFWTWDGYQFYYGIRPECVYVAFVRFIRRLQYFTSSPNQRLLLPNVAWSRMHICVFFRINQLLPSWNDRSGAVVLWSLLQRPGLILTLSWTESNDWQIDKDSWIFTYLLNVCNYRLWIVERKLSLVHSKFPPTFD